MRPPSVDFAALLVAAGLGTLGGTAAWSIFVSTEPERPSQSVTVYDSGGFPPDPQIDLDHPTIQIRVRGSVNGYTDAYTTALAVRDALHIYRGVVNGDTRYHGVWALAEPIFIGKDESARPLFTLNFRALRSPVTGAYPRQGVMYV